MKRKSVWLLTLAMLVISALILVNGAMPETAAQSASQSRIIAERAVDFPADI
ncbi:MAG: hypothetical protein WD397_13395 [Wenzhouxiangellaceae bacterium]